MKSGYVISGLMKRLPKRLHDAIVEAHMRSGGNDVRTMSVRVTPFDRATFFELRFDGKALSRGWSRWTRALALGRDAWEAHVTSRDFIVYAWQADGTEGRVWGNRRGMLPLKQLVVQTGIPFTALKKPMRFTIDQPLRVVRAIEKQMQKESEAADARLRQEQEQRHAGEVALQRFHEATAAQLEPVWPVNGTHLMTKIGNIERRQSFAKYVADQAPELFAAIAKRGHAAQDDVAALSALVAAATAPRFKP